MHQALTPAEHRAVLVGLGPPEAAADIFVDVDAAISQGRLAGTPGDPSRLLGRPTTALADTIRVTLAELNARQARG